MLDRIQATLDTLSPAEQRVGRLILQDAHGFCNLPVAELAQKAQVSKPTVVRFCRSLGYEGLSDFKLKLVASLSEGVPFIHRNVGVNDSANEVLLKVVDNTVAALLKYRNDASSAAIEKAVDAIVSAHSRSKNLQFFGVGNSGIVAQDAQHKFFRLGFHTTSLSDGHMQIMSASMLGAGDVLVIVSSSGRTRDLLDSCEIAHKNGATTVVITASGSPLSQAADIHLAADHPENYERFSPMVSRLLHLMIIDILATRTALRIGGEKLQPALRTMKHNLLKKRYS
jgi:RpiR family transcriptional regulator, carbohydrate utilization regulator